MINKLRKVIFLITLCLLIGDKLESNWAQGSMYLDAHSKVMCTSRIIYTEVKCTCRAHSEVRSASKAFTEVRSECRAHSE